MNPGAAAVASPIGVYLHWPYCARICPYCDFAVVRDRGRAEEQTALVEAMERDLLAQASPLRDRCLVSIFFGGGTPSLMKPVEAGRLIEVCRSLWPSDDGLEITLEANPTDIETDRLSAFREVGFNRLSLGVQALDDPHLVFLGRNHDAAGAIRAARLGASLFPRLSLDLIYGLPGQTLADWTETLKRVAGFGCEHLSCYELTIEAGTAFDRAVRRGRFSPLEPDLAAAFYETTNSVLGALGFDAYEVSNHAKSAEARSRHNLLYWRGEDYVGVGPSAHGRVRLAGGWRATETPSTPRGYMEEVGRTGQGVSISERLDPRSRAEERLLMGLRITDGVALTDLDPLPLSRLGDLVDAGLVQRHDGRLLATTAGRMVLDRVTQMLVE